MKDNHRLLEEAYLLPTPAGAFQAACAPLPSRARRLLFALMSGDESRLGTLESLTHWAGDRDGEATLELLYRLQNLRLIQGESRVRPAPTGPLEQVLPDLLPPLSDSGKALLADDQGLYVAACGFNHETAEELAALGGDLASLHGRHRQLLRHNMNLGSEAWGLLDAAGNSRVGFWQLSIGPTVFTLVLADVPFLNQPAFRDLIWALARRYWEPQDDIQEEST